MSRTINSMKSIKTSSSLLHLKKTHTSTLNLQHQWSVIFIVIILNMIPLIIILCVKGSCLTSY